MKNKHIIFGLTIFIFLFPSLIHAQAQNYDALLQFLKGDGAIEKWFMEVFTQLDTLVKAQANQVAIFGRAIGALGALIYLGYIGWQMLEGGRPWEVTPMIKPLIFGIILSNWASFTGFIQSPFDSISQPSVEMFHNLEEQADDYRAKTYTKQVQLLDALIKKQADLDAEQEISDSQKDKSWYDQAVDATTSTASNAWKALIAPIKEFSLRYQFASQKLFADVLDDIALTVLRVCVYLIFFIQKIWAYVLIVLGPIAFGLSLIPGFDNSWSNWTAKFININLYTFVAYTIINLGQNLIMAGYALQLERLSMLVDDSGNIKNEALLMSFLSNNGIVHNVIFPIVGYLVTGIGILMTPSIADAIVSGGSAHIASKIKAGAGRIASAGASAASSGSTTVISAAKAAATSSRSGSASGLTSGAMKKS